MATKKSQPAARKAAKKSAPKRSAAKKTDADIKVHLRDANPQTAYDVHQLVCDLGGTVKSTSSHAVTVEVPVHEDSERNPGKVRDRIIEGLANSPLVEGVD